MRKTRKPQFSPAEIEQERARLLLVLRTIPRDLLSNISPSQLIKTYKFILGTQVVWQMKKDFLKGDEMSEKEWVPKAENIGAQIVIEQVAGIASKTYANLGDGEKIGSEEALQLINKVLRGYDPSILDRNLKRRLPK